MKFIALFLFLFTAADSTPEPTPPRKQDWSFRGPLGFYQRDEWRRGLKVYKEVCSTCHSIKRVRLGKLQEMGLTKEEMKGFAALYEVPDVPDDEGNIHSRKAMPSDFFPLVYANDKAGRAANNGAYPPDLSVITKARKGGADYIFSLLTGYQDPPSGVTLGTGHYYNPYMLGGTIAMPPPLKNDLITYDDGTPATLNQMARDVVTFLSWAAEPELEERNRLGLKTLLYLIVMTTLMYFCFRKTRLDILD